MTSLQHCGSRTHITMVALFSVIVALTATGCFNTVQRTLLSAIESGRVLVGVRFDQPGLGVAGATPDAPPTGLDVDIATRIVHSLADAHGWQRPEIIWQDATPQLRQAMLKNGEADLIAAGYTITAERAAEVSFAGPYLATHAALLVRDDAPTVSASSHFCEVSGTTTKDMVEAIFPGAQYSEYDTFSACANAVAEGQVDTLLSDAAILYGLARLHPGVEVADARLQGDGEVDGKGSRVLYGIGLAKGDDQGTIEVNGVLAQMFNDGSLQALVDEHFGSDATKVFPKHPRDYPTF